MYNHPLKTRILQWMQDSVQTVCDDFEDLALELWADQVERNPQYGRWSSWVLQNQNPTRWQDIPAIPVTLFRDLSLTCFPPMLARHRFRTSGTTGPRGQHVLLDTEVYDNGSVWGRDALIGSVPREGVSLVSSNTDSSLGHMCRLFAPSMHQCFIPEIGVLRDEAFAYLRSATSPQFIPATAFAMASLLRDVSEQTTPIHLPQGSVIMITGGFKGKTQEIEADELIKRLHHLFPNIKIVGEYGMTELSSQMWSRSLEERFITPPWLKVVAVDPQTGTALPNGSIGQLKFIDLANHQTVLAIETRDQGIVHTDGTMELFGRLPKSDARGCSLSVEEVDRFFTQAAEASTSKETTLIDYSEHTTPLRISKVQTVLQELRDWTEDQIHSIAEGLSRENAVCGWHAALNALLKDNGDFNAHLTTNSRPSRIGIVLARGVFTAGIEWVSLALASGGDVHVKIPSDCSDSMVPWLTVFKNAGLPLTFDEDRNISPVDLLWIFGDDNSIDTIRKSIPHAGLEAYGHRFSIAVTTDTQSDARLVARDIAMYDTRGCMAPVAVLCTGDANLFAERLFEALREMEQENPLGKTDPFLGPEIRRRIGLAVQRANHVWTERKTHNGMHSIWGVLHQQNSQFIPSALSRLTSVYHTPTQNSIGQLLDLWKDKISTIGLSNALLEGEWIPDSILALNPRVCSLGEMQSPPFLRLHDGRTMWPQK